MKLFIWDFNDNDRAVLVHARCEDDARKAAMGHRDLEGIISYPPHLKILNGPPTSVVEEGDGHVYFNAGWEY